MALSLLNYQKDFAEFAKVRPGSPSEMVSMYIRMSLLRFMFVAVSRCLECAVEDGHEGVFNVVIKCCPFLVTLSCF